MKRFIEITENALTNAGWFEGRNVESDTLNWTLELLEDDFEIFPAALNILLEFGGLKLEQSGNGYLPLLLDPTLAFGENDRFSDFAEMLGNQLYPLGEFINQHYYLAVSDDGRVFSLMTELTIIGKNFNDALERIVQRNHISYLDPDYVSLY